MRFSFHDTVTIGWRGAPFSMVMTRAAQPTVTDAAPSQIDNEPNAAIESEDETRRSAASGNPAVAGPPHAEANWVKTLTADEAVKYGQQEAAERKKRRSARDLGEAAIADNRIATAERTAVLEDAARASKP